MKLGREELFELLNGFEKVKNLEGVKLAYAIDKNKKSILSEVKSMEASIKPTEKINEYEEKRIALCKKHCEKDEKENPVTHIADGRKKYSGLDDNDLFKKELKKLEKEYAADLEKRKKAIKEYNEMLKDDIKIDIHQVDFKIVPKTITVEQFSVIAFMVRGEK